VKKREGLQGKIKRGSGGAKRRRGGQVQHGQSCSLPGGSKKKGETGEVKRRWGGGKESAGAESEADTLGNWAGGTRKKDGRKESDEKGEKKRKYRRMAQNRGPPAENAHDIRQKNDCSGRGKSVKVRRLRTRKARGIPFTGGRKSENTHIIKSDRIKNKHEANEKGK